MSESWSDSRVTGQASAAFLNHLLQSQEWARERLKPFAGKCIELRADPLPRLRLAIRESGLLESSGDSSAGLTIACTPAALPRLLARDEKALAEVDFDGPEDLSNAVRDLYRHLKWDVEEDLSRIFGDVVAHRMALAGREFAAWQKDAGLRLGQNLAEYWTEEVPLLARPADLEDFARGVDAVREESAKLEQRIERLEISLARKQ